MSKSDNNSDAPPSTALIRPEQTRNLLEYSLQRLQGEAGKELLEAAQREALRLQVDAHERQLRRSMSQAEMDDFVVQAIRTVRQIDPKLTKVTMTGEFKGGTGQTSINVQSRTCFVATAVYESPDAPEVVALRRFRAEWLEGHLGGRVIIVAYNRGGPHLARLTVRYPWLRHVVKRVLDALVGQGKER